MGADYNEAVEQLREMCIIIIKELKRLRDQGAISKKEYIRHLLIKKRFLRQFESGAGIKFHNNQKLIKL